MKKLVYIQTVTNLLSLYFRAYAPGLSQTHNLTLPSNAFTSHNNAVNE